MRKKDLDQKLEPSFGDLTRPSALGLLKKSSTTLTESNDDEESEEARQAKGEVREYLPLLLKHMRTEHLETFTATQYGQPHNVIVLWAEEEWPRIFIHPSIEWHKDNLNFSVDYYDLEGNKCKFNTADSLWFVPRVVAKLRSLLREALLITSQSP